MQEHVSNEHENALRYIFAFSFPIARTNREARGGLALAGSFSI